MSDSSIATPSKDIASLLASTDIFGGLDESLLREFTGRLRWVRLAGGDTLMREGDPGDCLYILLSGRLRVLVEQPAGEEITVGEVGRGEVVGEMAILTDEPRSATVTAVRDCELLMFSREEFERLLEQHPQAMMKIARQIVIRLRQSIRSQRAVSKEFSIAVVPAGGNAPVSRFVEGLAGALERYGPTLVLNSEMVDRHLGVGVANTPQHGPNNDKILSWLNEQEAKHQYVMYCADASFSNWTRRCLRQADRVLNVGLAGDDPALNRIESMLVREGARESFARAELVLLHDAPDTRPSETSRWLEPRRVHVCHQIRSESAADFQRLARLLTGRAFGLVLGGGGARGLAHVGVLRAIGELGIPIDAIGGTSMGAIIAALYALDSRIEEISEACNFGFVEQGPLLDFTFPAVALTSGKRIADRLERFFGDTQIEDLWLRFFCVSSNLSQAEMMVHREGQLWRQVRASISLPGILPPIFHAGDLLVDGAVTNNLPVDVMRNACDGGTILAVDVSPKVDMKQKGSFGHWISGWRVLEKRVNPFTEAMDVPSLANILMRTTMLGSSMAQASTVKQADLCLRPPVAQFGLLEFESFKKIAESGYHHAMEVLEPWWKSMDAPVG